MPISPDTIMCHEALGVRDLYALYGSPSLNEVVLGYAEPNDVHTTSALQSKLQYKECAAGVVAARDCSCIRGIPVPVWTDLQSAADRSHCNGKLATFPQLAVRGCACAYSSIAGCVLGIVQPT